MLCKLRIFFILIILIVMPYNILANCTIDIDAYTKNMEEIHRLRNEQVTQASTNNLHELMQINKSYRFYMSAITYHVFRLVEHRKNMLAQEYLSSYTCTNDKAIVSLRALINYLNNPNEGIKEIIGFFQERDVARKVLFEMNGILFHEITPRDTIVPKIIRSYGSYSSFFTDILTKKYSSNSNAASVFNYLISKDDIGTEYIYEYVEYIKKNIPKYSKYAPLRTFMEIREREMSRQERK